MLDRVSPDRAAPAVRKPERGEELELQVDALAFGGNGVARLPLGDRGYVVFVQGAIAGDRVRAVVTKRKRDYAEARTVEVIEPGPDRIEPVADHPGAPWQILPYDRQLAVKQEQVDDALRRLGRLDGFELEPIVPATEQWRYRNKLEYSFGTGDDGELVCGFHAPGSWERILHIDDCLLASERGNELRRRALEACRAQGLGAYDRRAQVGFLRNLVVREGRRTGQEQVRIVTSPGDFDVDAFAAALGDVQSVIWTRAAGVAETTQGGRDELIAGTPRIEEEVCGLRFALSSEAFFQTNTEMAEVLYGVVGEYAQLGGFERVYDLCCGIGTIGLTLASRAAEVLGVEIVPEAVEDAAFNARANEISNARFVAGDVRVVLKDLVASGARPDVVVVDPPRAGLSKNVVARIAESSPKRIVYVSCNPTTLAPNAAQLVEAGYRLVRVRPVDQFPQTPHIECVALLERAA
jgi:23S rRNA (uracil1939-C5)-methyltransferase